ncbi:MAG: ATP-binding protein [Proteobacteria bacterium]|nr:ATP-binding protein [Pseudomonadota bacterium]
MKEQVPDESAGSRPGGSAPSGESAAPALFRTIRTLTGGDLSRRVGLHRRVTYLMLFRLVLISLVLGATLLLSWLSNVDPLAPNSLVLFVIIGTTYLLTIIYSLVLNRVADPRRLADIQLVADLITSALLVHVTGGAQSAYTFFFALSIIAAATIRLRAGAVIVAAASIAVFSAVSLLGWLDILPSFAGQRVLPSSLTSVELGRAMALNLAAFAGVAVLAYNLGGQIQYTSASLETQRTRVADLRALYQDIVRCLSSGLITVDMNGNVLTTNRVACDILELSSDEVVGKPVLGFMPELADVLVGLGDREEVRRLELNVCLLRRPAKQGRAGRDSADQPGDRPARSKPIELVVGVSVSPLRDNQDEVIGRIINFQDLTEMRAMEVQVRRAERLAVVGRLAAGVAHEIRNPLAAISGSIELLRTDPRSDDEGRALMDIITREVDRLNSLLTDLLDYTNPQPRELLRFDLVDLVRETMSVFRRDRNLGEVDVNLVCQCASAGGETALEIIADPGRVRQVVWNLLRNGAAAAESRVTLRIEQRGEQAVIEVDDDGPGITPEILPRVFEPFFTTKSSGTGMGLATCHSIITEHGGDIRIDSRPGQGCTFRVLLPLGTDEQQLSSRRASAPSLSDQVS